MATNSKDLSETHQTFVGKPSVVDDVPGKRQGIRVLDSWAFGNSYPTAGAPSVGFLSVSIGALYFFISLLAIFAGDKRQGLIVTAAVSAALSSLVLFLISFGELAGERLFLLRLDTCTKASGRKLSR